MKNLFKISLGCIIMAIAIIHHPFIYSNSNPSVQELPQPVVSSTAYVPGDTVFVRFYGVSADQLPSVKNSITSAGHFEWIAWCEVLNVACIKVATGDEQIYDLLKSTLGGGKYEVYPTGSGRYTINDKCFVY